MATITLLPKDAADTVCHEEQLCIWADEMLYAIAGYLRPDLSYDDKCDLAGVIGRELKEIVEMALDHPEARTIRTVNFAHLRDAQKTARPDHPPPMTPS